MPASLKAPPSISLLSEMLAPVQFSLLFWQAPWLANMPHGDGETVLVWPGFGAGDLSTLILRNYLSYLGYRAKAWPQGRNTGNVLALLPRLRQQVTKESSVKPVTIVGWSLGGYLAREVARECPENVARVITLGSPVIGGAKFTALAGHYQRQHRNLDDLEEAVEARYKVPLTVPVTAIYSKLDGIVAWQACIDTRSPNVEHIEVFSSHVGLGCSGQVFRIIANTLSTLPTSV